MLPFLDMPDGMEKFINRMIATTDPAYFKSNEKKWIREFRMYQHFGGYNEDVNYLYSTARTAEERARYLIALRDGKFTKIPVTLSDLVQALLPPFFSFAPSYSAIHRRMLF